VVTTVSDKVKFIQSVFGSGKLSRAAGNIDIWCPICAPKDKSKKKLSIRLLDDANHCWTCDWKARSLAPLIKKYGSREQLHDYVNRFMVNPQKKYLEDEPEAKAIVKLPDDFTLLTLASTHDPDTKAALRYVTGRGLSQHDLWYFKLGVSSSPRWARRIIVPSFDSSGVLNYFVARAIDAQKRPKYDNPDADKLTVIFNELNVDWTRPLVLCEGVFDMFKCGDNVVPLLGSSLNEQSLLFNMIIAHATPILLALDADMLDKRALSIASKLSEYDVNVSIVDVRPFDDPGKMSKAQFREKIELAKPYDWIDSFDARLRRATRTTLAL
jgi:DNA primase